MKAEDAGERSEWERGRRIEWEERQRQNETEIYTETGMKHIRDRPGPRKTCRGGAETWPLAAR